jgi:phage shock protein A
MALISRFTRMFRADLHAVLDRIEEPEVLLRQSVREMEENLHEDQRSLKILAYELENVPVLQAEVIMQLTQVQEEINLCLDSDNDKLARSKIRRKLELQQRAQRLQTRQEGLAKQVADLRERVATNQHRLEAMRQKLEVFAQEINQHHQGHAVSSEVLISDDDIEVALLREKKAHGKPAQAKNAGGAK